MRRTLLAIGFAVLMSMMLAPHGNKDGIVRGWGPFFSENGFSARDFAYWSIGRVMIDMLAVQTVFLAVLAAIVVNVRWRRRRKEVKRASTDKPVPPPPAAPQHDHPESIKAASRALDVSNDPKGTTVPPVQSTPKAGVTMEADRKSIWRFIGGILLLGGASNSLRNFSPPAQHNPDETTGYLIGVLLIVGAGLGLMISYLVKRPRKALVILGVCWLLAVSATAYTILKSAESNKQFGNATRSFASDVQGYVKSGGAGNFPTFKPTGDTDTDLFGRYMNDVFQSVASGIDGMNRELDAVGEKDVFETSVLTSKASLEAEARKRIEGQRIIAKHRTDFPRTLDAFREKVASSSDLTSEQKKGAIAGLEGVRPKVSQRYETMCNLLGNKEKAEFDFLSFMASAFNQYKLQDGQISFNNATVRQKYREFTKEIKDTANETAAFRKEWLDNANASLQKLNH